MPGNWLSLLLEGEEGDALDRDELDRERVRILIARYGIVIRPLLERELPGLSWKRLFGALRRMELAGELACGLFFEGVATPQFIGRERLGLFERLGSEGKSQPLWLSALDPASPAGFPFDVPQSITPARRLGNFICIEAGLVVGTATRGGKELRTLESLRDESRGEILSAWAERPGKVTIETINGRPAAESPWAGLFLEAGLERDRGVLRRW
jgi:ATP-dependent Lhr-like helicase